MKYPYKKIEKKWQKYWDENMIFKTEDSYNKSKYYVLDMYPYPSGDGLHVGHVEGYTATDVVARYKRMQGLNVLHPMGWDAFGLPAEQYAIESGKHPKVTTEKNIEIFKRQIKSLGLSYDWNREINTTDPKYYKWTQWIFVQLYNSWFDESQKKGRPINELPIPPKIKAEGSEAIQDYKEKKRLAYYAGAHVWWCENCKIVCSNEEVLSDGSHEKCGSINVFKKNLMQWHLRIPLYAERLLKGLNNLDWPEGIKEQQRNWIGRSEGALVYFNIVDSDEILSVYTTRPDTLFGTTFMVIAPEHELSLKIAPLDKKAGVESYIYEASLKSDLDRTDLAKEKTGVFTGAYAINPVNQEHIPIWMADYVLISYGTGAIMAVPAHDTRDFEFAKKYQIPITCILDPKIEGNGFENIYGIKKDKEKWGKLIDTPDGTEALRLEVLKGDECWIGDGVYINSASDKTGLDINGLSKNEGIRKTITWLKENGLGKSAVNYKLRDWLFSRQRYWGEPFPIIHWEDGEISVLEENLPLELPEIENYQPSGTGESPLANAKEWQEIVDPKTGRKGRRETNTMPQWAGSCWYYLRFIDPNNDQNAWDFEKENYWMPVDLYVGGAEHAVLHLLYARFWHHVLYDLGYVSTKEPFEKLFNQGMILSFAYEDRRGSKVPSDLVEEKGGKFFDKKSGEELRQITAKMSKTLKNVVNPDDVVRSYGADSLRLYEMFMGPLENMKPWDPKGIEGVHRFLKKVWMLSIAENEVISPKIKKIPPGLEIKRALHKTIKKVTGDLESIRFNTAIAQMMIFLNKITKENSLPKSVLETFIKLLSPFAPHIAEEIWSMLGHENTISYEKWPAFDSTYVEDERVTIVVQVNGKVRAKLEVEKGSSKDELEKRAKENEKIKAYIKGKNVKRSIIVSDKLVNLVIK